MADTSVEITAGSGINVDTRTEDTNGNHRQVVVLGDPATNAGVAPVDATAGLKVDLGADNDITGTVTANLSATDNAVLDAIAADTGTIAGDTTSIDGKLPALGQALAAASIPVILPAATVTTLTPPAAITGFATAANQLPDGHAVTIDNASLAVTGTFYQATQPISGSVTADLGANNDVTVTNATATNLKAEVVGTGTFATQATLAAETTKVIGTVNVAAAQTIAATQSGTWDEVGINDSGNSITVDNAQLSVVGSGTEATAMRVTLASDSTGVVSVDDNGGALTVDGTVAVTQATGTNLHAVVDSGTITTVSTVTAVTSLTNALPAGTNAIGKLAANSGVDIGDVTLTAGTAEIGSLLPPDTDVTAHTNYARKYYTSTGAATDGIIWSPAVGKRWHVVSMIINVSAAATVTLEDDKAGGDDPVWKAELAANSGVAINFSEQYPLASGEDAADLTITTSGGNIYVTVTGYEI